MQSTNIRQIKQAIKRLVGATRVVPQPARQGGFQAGGVTGAVGRRPRHERKRREQASQLDPYLSFIRERWTQGCHNIARIYRELATRVK
jgi:hypothetical protein